MHGIKAVMFDLDGCLCDTVEGIIRSVAATLEALGQPMMADEAIRPHIGCGARHLITECLDDKAMVEQALAAFREHYARTCEKNTVLYPAVLDTLGALRERGIVLGVQTNKFRLATMRILEGLGIAKFFSMILGEEDVLKRKPDPGGVLKFLGMANVKPREALFVGDMDIDIETARNAGVKCVAVTYGLGGIDTLQNADARIGRFDELLAFFPAD